MRPSFPRRSGGARAALLCATISPLALLVATASAQAAACPTGKVHDRHGHCVVPAKRHVKSAPGTAAAVGATTTGAVATQAAANPAPLAEAAFPRSRTRGSSENITVTGSLLAHSNYTATAPISVISAKQIFNSQTQTLEDILRLQPSVGTSGNYSSTNNGGNGSSCIDLRNLGINRTLVLVNGKRYIQSGYGDGFSCVDLDTIPLATIDHIDTLKDGASTIYGADAVAGVINVVMKQHFTGTQIEVGGNTSTYGDGREGSISGITGFDIQHGRGNVMLSGSYLDRGAVKQTSRNWANPVITADLGPGKTPTYNSGYIPTGRYAAVYSDNNYGTANAAGTALMPYKSAYRYNYGELQYLNGRLTQGNLNGHAYYDINDHITAYIDAFYTHKDTQTQLAGQPISGTVDGSQLYDIPQGNPYAEALGIDEQVYALRRSNFLGPRAYQTGTDTYQISGGLRGNITGTWNYDAYYSYGRSTTLITQTNQVNFVHLEQMAGFHSNNDPTDLDSGYYDPTVCTSQPGCVLANPFGPYSAAQRAYAGFNSHAMAYNQLRDLGVTITNNHLYQLPYGPIGVAVGMEHRGEDGAYHPDPIIQSGQSLSNTEQPTGGGFNATEAFGELNIPILRNINWAKDLFVDVSGRYSSYNLYGSQYNWKAQINYAPTKDVRFRADIGTATRQPSVQELFGGVILGFPSATDPCDSGQIGTYGALEGVVQANCAKAIKNYSSSFSQTGAGQVPTNSGGNADLKPETARTYTIGVVLTPRWVPNLLVSIDYWHTKIANQIGSVSTQYYLDECYTSANFSSPFCSGVAARSATTGQLTTVTAVDQNLGEVRTNGLDVDMSYLWRLPHGHSISVTNSLVDTIGYTAQQINGGEWTNYKGRLNIGAYGAAYPVIRDTVSATYAKGPFSLSWTTRFIDGMKLFDGSNDLDCTENRYCRVNEVFYHDIGATYTWHKVTFSGGVQNLLNKTPLFVPDASTNTDPSVYDIVGRMWYLKARMSF